MSFFKKCPKLVVLWLVSGNSLGRVFHSVGPSTENSRASNNKQKLATKLIYVDRNYNRIVTRTDVRATGEELEERSLDKVKMFIATSCKLRTPRDHVYKRLHTTSCYTERPRLQTFSE